tara:strand:+ start:29298 stop:29825 length:528 start_codon:yes stop_codon:yes gene_type:complete
MFNKLSNKNKFNVVIVLMIVFLLIAYNRSFKSTKNTVVFYIESMGKIKESKNLPDDLINLHVTLKEMDVLIGKNSENPKIIQNEILNFLSQNQEFTKLTKIDNLHIYSDSYFKIYSNKITVNGGFNDLMKTLNKFEREFEYARIASLKIYTIRDVRTSKKELYCDIIFQNYEKQN